MYIYVLNGDGQPLMPTGNSAKVRHLLKTGRAVVKYQKPFTIQLTDTIEDPEVQPLHGGIDPGRTNIGAAVVTNDGTCVYAAQVETANKSVPMHMKDRKAHRRASRMGERKRRQRRAVKCGTTFPEGEVREKEIAGCEKPVPLHYINNSEARFRNRKRPEGWLTPTANHLLLTHLNLIKKIESILPVSDWAIELNRFAFMQMEDGSVRGIDFQNGRLKGYPDKQSYIYEMQGGRCAICGAPIEEYHHIVPRSEEGSDTVENMVGLCRHCHHEVEHKGQHRKLMKDLGKVKKYGALSVLNQIIPHLVLELSERLGDRLCLVTGRKTKSFREEHEIDKDHYLDALCIACIPGNMIPTFPEEIFRIKQFRRHDRALIKSQHERTYCLDGKAVAKNRRDREEQQGLSLQGYLETFEPCERRGIMSRLTVKKSRRYYNNPNRILPGAVFYFEGKRYVMSGQCNHGNYLLAVGEGKQYFNLRKCTVRPSGGLVYL